MDEDVWETEDVTLTVVVSGQPEPLVEWFHGPKKLLKNKRIKITNVGHTQTLKLLKMKIKHSGRYIATACNEEGCCSVSAHVRVKG